MVDFNLRRYGSLALAGFLGLSSVFGAGIAHAGSLTVSIDGVQKRDGNLYVRVQTESQFMQDAASHGRIIDRPVGDVDVVFSGVDDGTYAISVWHDDNANGTFDFDERGMPLDGWALSGPGLTGAPSFDQTKISVEGDVSVTLRMIYGR